MQLTEKHVGSIMLPVGTVDLSAPYFHRGSRYRAVLDVVPGNYNCYVFEGTANHDWKQRVWIARIVSADRRMAPIAEKKIQTGRNWKQVATVGISDCMIGFYDRKPDFSGEQMAALCKQMSEQDWYLHHLADPLPEERNTFHNWNGDAFTIEHRPGNGHLFDVYAIRNNDQIIALEIRFGTRREIG